MRPLRALPAEAARSLALLFTDIDGTITDADGRVPARVFTVLEACRAAGLAVVPVTGRPAGWCDLIARTWPVDGVIGENGGLFFRRLPGIGKGLDARMERVFAQDPAERARNRQVLEGLAMDVLMRWPGVALASDQPYRAFDLAIDFCEDVPRQPESTIDGIVAFLEGAGCRVKVSDIHVNAWFGDFDKASMCRRVGRDVFGLDLLGVHAHRAAYFGDSPNDAPLFAAFPVAVGVANVVDLAHRIDPLPAWVTDGRGCDGFVEGVTHLLALRATARA